MCVYSKPVDDKYSASYMARLIKSTADLSSQVKRHKGGGCCSRISMEHFIQKNRLNILNKKSNRLYIGTKFDFLSIRETALQQTFICGLTSRANISKINMCDKAHTHTKKKNNIKSFTSNNYRIVKKIAQSARRVS